MAAEQPVLTIENHRMKKLEEMKQKGMPIVGYIPNGYMPEELVVASGAVPVALARGGDSAPVAAAASCLARFLDPYCRAQIGYYLLNEDPLYRIIDLLVVPVTDNHFRAIADSWDFFSDVDVYRLGVPHVKDDHGFAYYLESLNRLKSRLEQLTGTAITPPRLNDAIERANRIRSLFKLISLMRRSDCPPINGSAFIELIHHSFQSDWQTLPEHLKSITEQLQQKKPIAPKGVRLMLTGSTLASGDYRIIDLLEEAGASIVIEEFSEGLRPYWENVDFEDDPMRSIAKCYFSKRVPGAFFRGSAKERFAFLLKLISDFNVSGVVWYSLMYRDAYDSRDIFSVVF